MKIYFFLLMLITFIHLYYRWRLWSLSFFWFTLPFILYLAEKISKTQGILLLWVTILFIVVFNFKKLRRTLITNRIIQVFNNKEPAEWEKFRRIDSGWLSTNFERNLFNGNPSFNAIKKSNGVEKTKNFINIKTHIKQSFQHQSTTCLDYLIKNTPIAALNVSVEYEGSELNTAQCSEIIQQLSQHEPILGTLIGILNFDSVTTLVNQFGTREQKNHYLPAIAKGKVLPFFNTTSLYELLENNQSSLEGRVDIEIEENIQTHGIRISFTDIIMLGAEQSSLFYLAVNINDFANHLGTTTHLGTALCLVDSRNEKISVEKGNQAYSGYLNYYRCSAKDFFIPLHEIIGGVENINKGIEFLFKLQTHASSIWPTSVCLPIHQITTLLSWHYAHLKKQNGRSLLNYRLVKKQLNNQLAHYLKLMLVHQINLTHQKPDSLLSYNLILLKNSLLQITLDQLDILRTILGSHTHNLKTEGSIGNFYKVMHLSMELDGDSHEINQLPLMKKVALSTHPYYAKEIDLLSSQTFDDKKFDHIFFKHIGLILHQAAKVWAYTIKTSWLARLISRKNKQKNMIRRVSSSFAFIADISLIKWSLKQETNTEFTGYLAQCNQQLIFLMSLIDFYQTNNHNDAQKFIIKQSMKAAFHEAQTSINSAINSAFGRFSALLLKLIIFPFGKPFNKASFLAKNSHTLTEILPPETTISDMNENNVVTQVAAASDLLIKVKKIENAVTNATGSALTTKNFNVLIDRTLAAGIISVEQAETIRHAYQSILNLQLINHFRKHHESKKNS